MTERIPKCEVCLAFDRINPWTRGYHCEAGKDGKTRVAYSLDGGERTVFETIEKCAMRTEVLGKQNKSLTEIYVKQRNT